MCLRQEQAISDILRGTAIELTASSFDPLFFLLLLQVSGLRTYRWNAMTKRWEDEVGLSCAQNIVTKCYMLTSDLDRDVHCVDRLARYRGTAHARPDAFLRGNPAFLSTCTCASARDAHATGSPYTAAAWRMTLLQKYQVVVKRVTT